jgi:hypothetical protein
MLNEFDVVFSLGFCVLRCLPLEHRTDLAVGPTCTWTSNHRKEGGNAIYRSEKTRSKVVEVIIVSKDKCVVLLGIWKAGRLSSSTLRALRCYGGEEDERCSANGDWWSATVAQDPDSDKEMSGPPPAVLYSDPGRPPEQVRHELLVHRLSRRLGLFDMEVEQ